VHSGACRCLPGPFGVRDTGHFSRTEPPSLGVIGADESHHHRRAVERPGRPPSGVMIAGSLEEVRHDVVAAARLFLEKQGAVGS